MRVEPCADTRKHVINKHPALAWMVAVRHCTPLCVLVSKAGRALQVPGYVLEQQQTRDHGWTSSSGQVVIRVVKGSHPAPRPRPVIRLVRLELHLPAWEQDSKVNSARLLRLTVQTVLFLHPSYALELLRKAERRACRNTNTPPLTPAFPFVLLALLTPRSKSIGCFVLEAGPSCPFNHPTLVLLLCMEHGLTPPILYNILTGSHTVLCLATAGYVAAAKIMRGPAYLVSHLALLPPTVSHVPLLVCVVQNL